MDPQTVDLPENKEGQENISHQEEKKKIPWFPILVILITVLIVFMAAQREDTNETTTDTTDQEGVAEQMTEGNTPAELPSTTYLNADTFEGRTQAEDIINSTQGKAEGTDDYERIQSGIVEDTEEENIVYFATLAHNTELNEVFVGVYKYDTLTYRWHRLYKNTYKADGDVSARYLRVVGKQGGDLILFMDALDSEFDTCDSYWLIGTESSEHDLLTLNIENSLDGLQDYEAPTDLIDEERTNVTNCKGDDLEEADEDKEE
jgi:hypothetical protein